MSGVSGTTAGDFLCFLLRHKEEGRLEEKADRPSSVITKAFSLLSPQWGNTNAQPPGNSKIDIFNWVKVGVDGFCRKGNKGRGRGRRKKKKRKS